MLDACYLSIEVETMLKKFWVSLVMVSALSLVAQAQDGHLHLIEDSRPAAEAGETHMGDIG